MLPIKLKGNMLPINLAYQLARGTATASYQFL